MKNGVGWKLKLAVLPFLGAWFVRGWFATCRINEHDRHYRREVEESGRPLICTCWHYCVLGVFPVCRNIPMVLMISASNDGEILARMAERFGFSVVRGSSNRKGASAAKELIRKLRQGNGGGLVADGSQGPARIAQSGSLLMAARSGATVVPMVYSTSSYFAFNTWDRLILPKPFSRIDVFYGEPLEVPEDVKASGLEAYRQTLDERLNALYLRAWEMYGKTSH